MYKGHTDNLDRRLEEHNSGGSPYTQWRGSRQLIGWLPCKQGLKLCISKTS
ncbi:MAG: hypothetical protein IIA61_04810 [Candidatus Marinimicrobia bacterium]|nr:hypothetical protein [Candidatus Neomarinimicrobiota bacterium]